MRALWLWLAIVAAPAPAQAVEPFVGRWAVNPTVCSGFGNTSASAPLVAGDMTLRWYSGFCRVAKMYKLVAAFYLQAHCSGETASDIPGALEPRGDRMRVTWNRGKPEGLRRCP